MTMTNNILEYKGYHARIEYDKDDQVLRGRIEGIGDDGDEERRYAECFC